jgi:hypothetical protein
MRNAHRRQVDEPLTRQRAERSIAQPVDRGLFVRSAERVVRRPRAGSDVIRDAQVRPGADRLSDPVTGDHLKKRAGLGLHGGQLRQSTGKRHDLSLERP